MRIMNERKEYTIVKLRKENLENIEKLYAAVYHRHPAKDHFIKKYGLASVGKAYNGYFVFNPDNTAVAFLGIIPCNLQYNDRVIFAAQLTDGMTHPRYRSQGLFEKLVGHIITLCQEINVRLVFGFPNQKAAPVLINKAGWQETEKMDRFMISVNARLISLFLSRVKLFRKFYKRYKQNILSKYLTGEKGVANAVRNEGYAGVVRDNSYLEYKTGNEKAVIQVGSSKAWIRVGREMFIGDMEVTEDDFEKLTGILKVIAKRIGTKEIVFITSKHTFLHSVFSKRYKAFPSFPVLFRDLGAGIPLEKIKFTFADIDIF